jgi:hypothetical protein
MRLYRPIKVFCSQVTKQIKDNESKTMRFRSVFDKDRVPVIPLEDYLLRFGHYYDLLESDLPMMLFFMDAYFKGVPADFLNHHNVFRLVLTSYVYLLKNFHLENDFSLAFFARLGGIETRELVEMEKTFAASLQLDINLRGSAHRTYEQAYVAYSKDRKEIPPTNQRFNNRVQYDPRFLAQLRNDLEEMAEKQKKESKPDNTPPSPQSGGVVWHKKDDRYHENTLRLRGLVF